MNQFLEAALKYASFGWHVFPLAPGQKIPITKHGVKDATTDVSQIKAWWKKWPDANIAVACGPESGVYVIDVDVDKEKGINGYESMKELGKLPLTVAQETPRGGSHAFYKTDNPPANKGNFRAGVEIKGKGLYVVLAPSIHPNGGVYQWAAGCAPGEIEITEFPDFMRPATNMLAGRSLTLNLPGSTVPATADDLQRASAYLATCDPAIQGQAGHSKLLWAAAAMVHKFKLSDRQAEDILEREYNPRCIPPWDMSIPRERREFQRKIPEARKNPPAIAHQWEQEEAIEQGGVSQEIRDGVTEILKRHEADLWSNAVDTAKRPTENKASGIPYWLAGNTQPKNSREAASEGSWAKEIDVENETVTPAGVELWLQEQRQKFGLQEQTQKQKSELKFLCSPPGLVGQICDWINKTAMCPQPFLSLACTLAFCGALFGRKVRDYLNTRTNIYCMGVAESSAGKNHAPSQIRRLCAAVGCTDLLGGDSTASDAAIEERMTNHPATVFLWDEIGHLLSNIKASQNPHLKQVVSLFMRLYSASSSIFTGREYADAERQRIVIQPCCCLYGTSTPMRFIEGITLEELQDGWLSRCLVFRVYDVAKKLWATSSRKIPQSICEQVGAWFMRQVKTTDGHNIDTFVNQQVTGTLTVQPPEQIEIPIDDPAERVFRNFHRESRGFGREYPQLDCLWAKAEENARKVALIIAAGVNYDSPRITPAIADYAQRLVKFLLLDFGETTVPAIVTSQVDANKQKLLKIIEAGGTSGRIKRDITRSSQWMNKRERDALLADMQEAESIVVAQKTDQGSRAAFYWAFENYRKYLEKQGGKV